MTREVGTRASRWLGLVAMITLAAAPAEVRAQEDSQASSASDKPIFLLDDDLSQDGVQALLLLMRDGGADLRYVTLNGAADVPALPSADAAWQITRFDDHGDIERVGHGCDTPVGGPGPGGFDYVYQFTDPLDAISATCPDAPAAREDRDRTTALEVWNEAAASGTPVHVLVTGGMTNFARFLQDLDCHDDPAGNGTDVLRMASLTIMGGRGLDEFNFKSDPRGLQIVLEAIEFGHPRLELLSTPRLVSSEIGETQPMTIAYRDHLGDLSHDCVGDYAHELLTYSFLPMPDVIPPWCPAAVEDQLGWVHPYVSLFCLIPYFYWDTVAAAWARKPQLLREPVEVGAAVLGDDADTWRICYSDEPCWDQEEELNGRTGARILTTPAGGALDAVDGSVFEQYYESTVFGSD